MCLKVGIVLPYDWSIACGVREHTRYLANQLILMGHDIRILAPAIRPEGMIKDEHIYDMGRSMPFRINGTVAHVACAYSLNSMVQHVFQKERFDIVHIQEPLLPGLPLIALRASNTVTVGTFHAFPEAKVFSVPSLGYRVLNPFIRSSFSRLAGRIAVSSVAQEFVSHFFPADYRIIPNGIDVQRFNPAVMPLPELMDGKQNILFIGRFDARKGAKYLVHAIPLIRLHYPHTRFIFVGEGHLKQHLQEFVQKQGWPDVLFTGYVPTAELPRYFASAHLFCSPATGGESMGIVLLEAMASGVPIVATAIPGYKTLVEPGVDGLLTLPMRSSDLAHTILQLLESQPMRQLFVANGLQKAQNYAWPQVAQRVVDYYVSLLQREQSQFITSRPSSENDARSQRDDYVPQISTSRKGKTHTNSVTKDLYEELHQFRLKHVYKCLDVNGVRWKYLIGGKGKKVLLLLPGAPGICETSFQQITTLESSFRVLSVIYPSSATTLAQVIHGLQAIFIAENIDEFHVVGTSFGGVIAQKLFMHMPDKIGKVVLICTGLPGKKVVRVYKLYGQILSLLPLKWIHFLFLLGKEHLLSALTVQRAFWNEYYDQLIQSLSKEDYLARIQVWIDCHENERLLQKKRFVEVKDILIIEAENDAVFPLKEQLCLKTQYPQAHIYKFSQATHMVMVNRMSECIQVMMDFLRESEEKEGIEMTER